MSFNSQSPLVNNVFSAVKKNAYNLGLPKTYDIIDYQNILAVLTELSTDSLIPADAQAVLVAQLALTANDGPNF